MSLFELHTGDSVEVLRSLPDNYFHSCITSPPYYGQRDYHRDGQIGNEETLEEYVERLVRVFREVRRVLRPDGSCWINLGDKYKNKNLLNVPFVVAEALKKEGWKHRNTLPWVKRNAIPCGGSGNVNQSIEWVLKMSGSAKCYFDMESAKDCIGISRNWRNGDALLDIDGLVLDVNTVPRDDPHMAMMPPELAKIMVRASTSDKGCDAESGEPYHRVLKKTRRATRPGKTVKDDKSGKVHRDRGRHVTDVQTLGWDLKGTDSGNIVPCRILDPFSGAATTGKVALGLGRSYVGIDLNEEYNERAFGELEALSFTVEGDCFEEEKTGDDSV